MIGNRVLIFEDDPDIALLLERTFKKEGFSTACCYDGRGFSKRVTDHNPDLVLLDLMLPDIDGFTICRCLKDPERERDVKVIMLTAKSEESDILHGYEVGADDYVTKPFSPKEVLARAKAVLRRRSPKTTLDSSKIIKRGQLRIDDLQYEASIAGSTLELTHSEYRILRALARHPRRVYTREQLADSISEKDLNAPKLGGSRNIDVHIRALRKKLHPYSNYIKTLRGVGYSFDTIEG